MSQQFPVYVRGPRGERVQVGAATRESDGSFTLQLGELTVGAEAASAPRSTPRAPAQAPAWGGGGGGYSGGAGGLPTVFPNYGRSKGAPISGASQGDLEFYANGARRSLNDPSKERFHDKERALLTAIEQELARQGGGGGGGGGSGYGNEPDWGDEPPPPGDDDAPF